LPSYGLVVEGEGDQRVYENLVPRIDSPDATVYCRSCGGVGRLMREFSALLKTFEYVHEGAPVDLAIVIRDTDMKPPALVMQKMREQLRNRRYPFPIELCVVVRKLDTWLLADETAINAVARLRDGKVVARINEDVETIVDPKTRLQRTLTAAGLPYNPRVLEEIAQNANLQTLQYRSASFRQFEASVLRNPTL